MASLKELRNRIKSVKATQKITKAMKMVAASKLRRAREQAENSRPYATSLERMLQTLAGNLPANSGQKLLVGNGRDNSYLLIVASGDRGLCGGFNSGIVKLARRRVAELQAAGKEVAIITIGRKAGEQVRTTHSSLVIDRIEDLSRKKLAYDDAAEIGGRVSRLFDEGRFDVAEIIYSRFKSVILQLPTVKQIIPLPIDVKDKQSEAHKPAYLFEPNEEAILADILPKNLNMQVYSALLENAASEQGARMSAMDNATRNAGEMIKKVSLVYNRNRQATITKELIEIISGAEAV